MDENKGYEGFERFGLKLLSLINEYDLKYENNYEIKEDTGVLKYTITLTGYFPKIK